MPEEWHWGVLVRRVLHTRCPPPVPCRPPAPASLQRRLPLASLAPARTSTSPCPFFLAGCPLSISNSLFPLLPLPQASEAVARETEASRLCVPSFLRDASEDDDSDHADFWDQRSPGLGPPGGPSSSKGQAHAAPQNSVQWVVVFHLETLEFKKVTFLSVFLEDRLPPVGGGREKEKDKNKTSPKFTSSKLEGKHWARGGGLRPRGGLVQLPGRRKGMLGKEKSSWRLKNSDSPLTCWRMAAGKARPGGPVPPVTGRRVGTGPP